MATDQALEELDQYAVRKEFEELLRTHAPDLRRAPRTRNFDGGVVGVIYQAVVTATALGAFRGLWEVFHAWFEKHSGCRVKVTYQTPEGPVEIEFTRLTMTQALKIARDPPRASPALVQIYRA